jgi:hypothetical protein
MAEKIKSCSVPFSVIAGNKRQATAVTKAPMPPKKRANVPGLAPSAIKKAIPTTSHSFHPSDKIWNRKSKAPSP